MSTLLCPLRARYLEAFATLHDPRCTLPEFLHERSIVLLDRVHRVTQELVEASKIAKLRAQGLGWKKISRELGVGVSTVLRITQESRISGSENPKPKNFRTPARKIRIDSAGGSAVTPKFRLTPPSI
jgi:hypothetical protein